MALASVPLLFLLKLLGRVSTVDAVTDDGVLVDLGAEAAFGLKILKRRCFSSGIFFSIQAAARGVRHVSEGDCIVEVVIGFVAAFAFGLIVVLVACGENGTSPPDEDRRLDVTSSSS